MERKLHRARTLLNFALTSRRLYRIITEMVYARFSNTYGEPYLFLRTMISNPQLARLVRDVDITIEYETRAVGPHTPTAQDKKVIKEGLRALDIPYWKDCATDCYGSTEKDHGVMRNSTILLFTPNVTSIRIECSYEYETPCPVWVAFISRAVMGRFGNAHGFERLRSITIVMSLTDVIAVSPLFHIQSLRTLQLHRVRECSEYDDQLQPNYDEENIRKIQRLIPQACNNLEELVVENIFYTEDCLEALIASSRRLKVFKTRAATSNLLPESRRLPTSKSKTVIGMLGRHKTSLETLHVDRDDETDRDFPDKAHVRNNMKAFTSLKELSCPLAAIMTGKKDRFVERLPPSLVTFRTHFRNRTCDLDWIGGLEHMLANYEAHIPQLCELRVETPYYSQSEYKETVKRLARPSAKAGIVFSHAIRHYEYWHDPEDTVSESSESSDDVSMSSDEDRG